MSVKALVPLALIVLGLVIAVFSGAWLFYSESGNSWLLVTALMSLCALINAFTALLRRVRS